MKVVFVKELSGTARKGEVKDFNDGYARNFLIAKGYALAATAQMLSKIENEQRQQRVREEKQVKLMHELKADMDKRVFSIKVKVGAKNQIFGSVHEKDIAARIKEKTGVQLDKSQITMPKHIKELGEYQIELKLGSGVLATPRISLVAE